MHSVLGYCCSFSYSIFFLTVPEADCSLIRYALYSFVFLFFFFALQLIAYGFCRIISKLSVVNHYCFVVFCLCYLTCILLNFLSGFCALGCPYPRDRGARRHMAEKFILTHTHTRDVIYEMFQGTDSSPAPRTNHKAVLRVFRHFLGVFLLKHGRAISDPNIGLAGLGLGECGKVLCAGDLEYKLDTSGWAHVHMELYWRASSKQVQSRFQVGRLSSNEQRWYGRGGASRFDCK